ncbi:PREDICTED: mitotic spindle-associated MMXD complex subunit MIP18-like [Amphimedon queenslandica]|uniref:MIP18 family-like domain-containing protein n=1 Tax=Amphimedon queenslandica TaxID=400682 RepID=A0A1X7VK83_AMPQE|nr:PREDICTED: mitotic spindle-associated MMXD complex subunit MIP18-like [Amphimedon queenslandica]|eukprot:XP_003384023.1 PREDICTED: mitotic spindle-associated MMXD complex subunit MIP18-like [Amphimedon queenslandica]
MMAADNANPVVFEVAKQRPVTVEEEKDDVYDEIDAREVFDLIRHINDPEHPLTLEELNVVQEDLICINNKENFVSVHFTPTIPHCSMATLIGLSIRVCLLRSLPNRFKIDVIITPGSHMSEQAINKQLADKERIAAAIENSHLLNVVHQCLNTKRKQ